MQGSSRGAAATRMRSHSCAKRAEFRKPGPGRAAQRRLRPHDRAPVAHRPGSSKSIGALARLADPRLAAIAAKALKETQYHSATAAAGSCAWGTARRRAARGCRRADELWPFTDELFADGRVMCRCGAGIAPDLAAAARRAGRRASTRYWRGDVDPAARCAFPWHGKRGVHTEHLSYLLAEMQLLPRAYPGARW